MAKKKPKRKRTKQSKKDYSTYPVKVLANMAEGKLTAGCFGQAVDLYKKLLKKDSSGLYMSGINKAYTGRILELAAKSMYKEALIFYQNMVSMCGIADHALHLTLLFNSGRFEQALKILPLCLQAGSTPPNKEIMEVMAALLLSNDYHDLVNQLPAESLIRAHYPFALQALEEFEAGNFAGAEENIRKISFKSPYKDFRIVLQVLLATGRGEGDKAFALARKVAPESPFYSLAAPCSLEKDSEKIEALSKVKGTEFDYYSTVFNIPAATAELVAGLHKNAANPHKLFECLIKNVSAVDRDLSRELCRHILPYAPKMIKRFQQEFGPLSPFEVNRITALAHEVAGDTPEAVEIWHDALESWPQQGKKSLVKGAIWRHLFHLVRDIPDFVTGLNKVSLLTESLFHDPDHKPAYLQLFKCSFPVRRNYYKLVEMAVQHFPDDVDILLEAIKAAVSKGAFKKASRLAARLLEVDPLNIKAGSLLIEAHLSHGHKLYRAGKIELARREFKKAVRVDCRNTDSAFALICMGLFTMITSDEREGRRLFAQGRERAGSRAAAALGAAIEARVLKAPAALRQELGKELKAVNKTEPDRDDIAQIITLIKKAERMGTNKVMPAGSILNAFMANAAKLKYEEVELKGYCDFFSARNEYKWLKPFAAAGVTSYPNNPFFTYYHVLALTAGGRNPLSRKSVIRLEEAQDLAAEQGNCDLEDLIDDLLAENYYGGGYPGRQMPFNRDLRSMLNSPDLDEIIDEFGADLERIIDDEVEDEDEGVPWEPERSFVDIDTAGEEKSKGKGKNKKQLDLF
ncbi:MAG TPA: hypothetical protein ENK33_03745 [Desulfobacterales bacterium]|nr:hypothetical protein [Desulfobacterales bacterium]